jgi:hypothetical protein
MAFCMQCKEKVPALTIVCPHCGHDFLDRETPAPEQGWEYSEAANVMLLIGFVVSAIASLIMALMTLAMLVALFISYQNVKETLWQLVCSAFGTCMCLANMIVFSRVANLSHNKK